jgi:hypothetical protein
MVRTTFVPAGAVNEPPTQPVIGRCHDHLLCRPDRWVEDRRRARKEPYLPLTRALL